MYIVYEHINQTQRQNMDNYLDLTHSNQKFAKENYIVVVNANYFFKQQQPWCKVFFFCFAAIF